MPVPKAWLPFKFASPRTDACAERLSFELHIGYSRVTNSGVAVGEGEEARSQEKTPGEAEIEEAAAIVADRYLGPWRTNLYNVDFERDFDRLFDEALQDLNKDSSVGLCDMSRYGSTIGEALKAADGFGNNFDPERVEILRRLVIQRMENPGDADNIKVFIKKEPHKMSKIVEKRYRLISAVSLVDTMTDRVMFRWLMRASLSTVLETPCLIGWNPLRGGYRFMEAKFGGLKTRGLDKTAWDWTVREWLIKAVKEVLKHLAVGANDYWLRWLDQRWQALFRDAVFEFSDGTVIAQPGWGVMKSGCYLTIIINSIGQMLYHALALRHLDMEPDSLKFVTIGDDVTLEDFERFREYEQYILDHGALLKPSEPTSHVEFAGFIFGKDGGRYVSWPEYWEKHLYAISHSTATLPEMLFAYQILYANEPVFLDWVRRCLAEVDSGKVRSLWSLRTIWECAPRW